MCDDAISAEGGRRLTWTIQWSDGEHSGEPVAMKVSVTEAKGQLTELVKRAEEGEEVILTRFGRPVVRLAPVGTKLSRTERRAILEQLRAAGRANATPGPSAARSQDFL